MYITLFKVVLPKIGFMVGEWEYIGVIQGDQCWYNAIDDYTFIGCVN